MSLILDALRKMEQERRVRRQGAMDIRPEVLSYRGNPRKTSGNKLLLPVVAGVALVLTGIAAGLLLREERPLPSPQPARSEAQTAAVPEMQTVATPQPAPAPQPVQTTPATPLPAPRVAPPSSTAMKTPAEEQHTAVPQGANSAPLTISGIAWQEERSLRRAVVNGALVAEGGEIAGARVVEIKENRIRFSRDGQSFEVVQASGPALR